MRLSALRAILAEMPWLRAMTLSDAPLYHHALRFSAKCFEETGSDYPGAGCRGFLNRSSNRFYCQTESCGARELGEDGEWITAVGEVAK